MEFLEEYTNVVNGCIEDIYKPKWNEIANGLDQAVYDGDDISWSNLNYIADSRLILDLIIIPKLSEISGKQLEYNYFSSIQDEKYGGVNREIFSLLWAHKHLFFYNKSPLFDDVVKVLKLWRERTLELNNGVVSFLKFVTQNDVSTELNYRQHPSDWTVKFIYKECKCLGVIIPIYKMTDQTTGSFYAHIANFTKKFDVTNLIFCKRNHKLKELEMYLVKNENIRPVNKVYAAPKDTIIIKGFYDLEEQYINNIKYLDV